MASANPAKLAQQVQDCLSVQLQMLIKPSPINTSKQLVAVIKNQRSMTSMAPPLTQVSPNGNHAPLPPWPSISKDSFWD